MSSTTVGTTTERFKMALALEDTYVSFLILTYFILNRLNITLRFTKSKGPNKITAWMHAQNLNL